MQTKKWAVALVFTDVSMDNVTVAQFLTVVAAGSEKEAIEKAKAEVYEQKERDVRRLNLLQKAALELES